MSRHWASRLTDATTTGPAYTATPTDRLCAIFHGWTEDGEPLPVPAVVGRLCVGHRVDLDRWAREIADGWVSLALMVEPARSARSSAGGGKRADPPAPIDLTAAALRDHRNPTARPDTRDVPSVPGVVASWLLLVDEELPLVYDHTLYVVDPAGQVEPRRILSQRWKRLPRSVLGQLELLVTVHDWMAEQDWIGDYWQQLHDVHAALLAKTDGAQLGGDRGSRAIALAVAEAAGRR